LKPIILSAEFKTSMESSKRHHFYYPRLAIGVKNDFSLPFGWGTADGYHVKVNGQSAVLPFNFTGNSLELKSILQS
jgi:hypothetical protein